MTTATAVSEYIAVPIATLRPDSQLDCALYLEGECEGQEKLYRGAHLPLEYEQLQNLAKQGRTKVLVRSEEYGQYQAYLRDNLSEVLDDESIPLARRFAALDTVLRGVLSESFAAGDNDATVDACRRLSVQVADLVSRDDAMETDLLAVMQHDYYTFTHSANVSYYCTMLAARLGVEDPDELQQITAGALMHDLGKLEIPDSILTKPGRLSDEEFAIIRRHPTTGFRQLCRRDDLSHGQLMMVYQHHERMDGGGYPTRMVGDEIHPWARICAVADVYEALTSNRPYRKALSREVTLEIMLRDSGTAFDQDCLKAWVECLTQ
ncbi:HD-GYP domain-containing protein [Pseudobythopirellula maris]|uniref:HD-GYP domain-containing protein n=1 Tax=Pseudobythopirellula maris TaxID=2527991 RepID=UPI001E37FC5B|nr:HD-GYP domain-containing protein [Pseudobythopirellula maris]